MEIIIRPRQGGKSIESLRRAAAHFAHIVVASRQEVEELWRTAKQMQLDIPMPITWREFVKSGYHGRGAKAFVIDNLDRCLQSEIPVPVIAVTLTDGRITDTNTPVASVQAGDFDRYGRKHFRIEVDGVPYTGWLEPAAADPGPNQPPPRYGSSNFAREGREPLIGEF